MLRSRKTQEIVGGAWLFGQGYEGELFDMLSDLGF